MIQRLTISHLLTKPFFFFFNSQKLYIKSLVILNFPSSVYFFYNQWSLQQLKLSWFLSLFSEHQRVWCMKGYKFNHFYFHPSEKKAYRECHRLVAVSIREAVSKNGSWPAVQAIYLCQASYKHCTSSTEVFKCNFTYKILLQHNLSEPYSKAVHLHHRKTFLSYHLF